MRMPSWCNLPIRLSGSLTEALLSSFLLGQHRLWLCRMTRFHRSRGHCTPEQLVLHRQVLSLLGYCRPAWSVPLPVGRKAFDDNSRFAGWFHPDRVRECPVCSLHFHTISLHLSHSYYLLWHFPIFYNQKAWNGKLILPERNNDQTSACWPHRRILPCTMGVPNCSWQAFPASAYLPWLEYAYLSEKYRSYPVSHFLVLYLSDDGWSREALCLIEALHLYQCWYWSYR